MKRAIAAGWALVVLVAACAKAAPTPSETIALAPPAPSAPQAIDSGALDAAPPPTDVRPTPEDAGEPTIPCASVDDCWIDARQPIARPKALRGRKFKPCRDGEVAPKCKDGVCAAVPYKC